MSNKLVIVSGLPRSGTSLMMGALKAGGMELVVDAQRPADEHNQAGYFEHQAVKDLAQDNSWLKDHSGQAVKIIYRLLYHLPEDLPAKILFMRRDVREVAASQNAMLDQQTDVNTWSRALVKELMKVDRWLKGRSHLEMMNVPHRRALQDSEAMFAEVNEFLGGGLEVAAMTGTVQQKLYRQRS